MTDPKPIIAIVGATGTQGGSVVNALLQSGHFAVRALTRNAQSDSAKALTARGAEAVECNVYDPATLDRAFRGVHGVFATTYQDMQGDRAHPETDQGKNIADASQRAGVKHVVFSTLPSANKLSGGKYKGVQHFDDKAVVADYMRELGLPTTFFNLGYYMNNLTTIPIVYQKSGADAYEFLLPVPGNTTVPVVDVAADIGRCASYSFLHPEKTVGQEYLIASGFSTFDTLTSQLSQFTHKDIRVRQLTPEEQAKHPFYGIEDYNQMFQYYRDFGYSSELDLTKTEKTFGKLTSFADFLAREKHVPLPE
ncbi:hypothetical protein IWQ60_001314 [Tieghemiomyces parasiticus]|uniref:NmrA-like domain-containing protein n=1 Tax=Tieghemiomyces parasiticus TaxID=78921 RepID=A0A9W8E1Z8_9FUNG|nr:hypothetical protein IWQ60_001314 [Tieghemiomyces parasiticus]